MANTYTQLNIQLIFAVKNRENIISFHFRESLHKYIFGILKNSKQFPLAVNGPSDHIHAFFELNPSYSVSEIARLIKSYSSKWINENNLVKGKFQWQEGYGAFSYSRSNRDAVIKYIINQEEHHRMRSFKEEYLDFLSTFDIDYNENYLFDWIEP